jgi:integrase/recombinase XerD
MGFVLSNRYAEIYNDFIEFQKPRVSERGLITLCNLTRSVLKWFDDEEVLLDDVDIACALRFKQYISEKKDINGKTLAPGSVCNYLKAVKKLFSYLLQTDRRDSNPFAELRYPAIPERINNNVLTESQMSALLNALSRFDEPPLKSDKLKRYRAHVVAEFLYATGLRIAEACSLREADIDLQRREVYLPCGKGDKKRTAFLTAYAAEVLKHYIAQGRAAIIENRWRKHNDTLLAGDRATIGNAVSAELRILCKTLELPVVTCHAFRHSLGTHLLQHGADMRHIQIILGHDKLSSTQIYTRVYKDDLKRSLDSHHPRQWRKAEE